MTRDEALTVRDRAAGEASDSWVGNRRQAQYVTNAPLARVRRPAVILTPDAIPVILRVLKDNHRVDVILAPYRRDDGEGDEWLPTVRIDGYFLPGSPASLDKWLGLPVEA